MATDWTSVRLGDLVRFRKGVSYQGKFLDMPGPRLLGLGTIVPGGGSKAEAARQYSGPLKTHHRIGPGEIYVALTDLTQAGAVLGSPAIVPQDLNDDFAVTHHVARLEIIDAKALDKSFLYYLLRSPQARTHMWAMTTGTTVRAVAPKDAENLIVDLPPLKQQESIAIVLAGMDDKIELNRQMSETLDEIARALFDEWFKIDVLAELSSVAHQTQQLRDVLTLAYGKGLRKADRVPGPVPVYGSGGVFDHHNEALLEGPTIIVGRKGTVGKLYWVDGPSHPGDTVFYVESKYPLTYCYYLLGRLGLEEMNTDAAVPGLNRENAYRLEVPSPPDSLIEHFDAVVAPMRERIRFANDESAILASLRDTLLPKLISGELRIPDAEKLVSEVT